MTCFWTGEVLAFEICPAAPTGGYVQLPDGPEARATPAMASVGGKIYVLDTVNESPPDTLVYDIAGGTWTTATAITFGSFIDSACSIGAVIYMYASSGSIFFKYDTLTNTTSTVNPPGLGLIRNSYLFGVGPNVYMVGTPNASQPTVYLLNVGANTFTNLSPANQSVLTDTGNGGGVFLNNKFYFMGVTTADLYIYDVATNAWSLGGAFPFTPLAAPVLTVVNGELQAYTVNVSGGNLVFFGLQYDAAGGTWSSLTTPDALNLYQAGQTTDGTTAYVYGSYSGSGNDTELWQIT